MLLLLFRLQSDRYALDVSHVVEVLPLVEIKRLPQSPRGVAGVFSYRGTVVPVIDLSDLILSHPAETRLSTRVIVVRCPTEGSETALLGLIAEHATETMRRPRTDFMTTSITNDEAPYLGPVASDASGMVQLLDIGALLPPSVRDVLFRRPVGV